MGRSGAARQTVTVGAVGTVGTVGGPENGANPMARGNSALTARYLAESMT